MKHILYVLLGAMLIGAAGMALANKKATRAVAGERWLKFGAYLVITCIVLASIFLKAFFYSALVIVLFGFYELLKTLKDGTRTRGLLALIIYSIGAGGFLWFAFYAPLKMQLFVYYQVIIFDAFCQVAGQLYGKKQLAPAISPTKTVEGLAGGALFCIMASLLAFRWMDETPVFLLALGIFTALTAFAGDMLASFYKRKTGIKDYSNLLPGQGGFLDRFDSLLMTGCCYACIMEAVF